MCHQITERYALCGCLYYKHPVDLCSLANVGNHTVTKREVKVGVSCPRHSSPCSNPTLPSPPKDFSVLRDELVSSTLSKTPASSTLEPSANTQELTAREVADVLLRNLDLQTLFQNGFP